MSGKCNQFSGKQRQTMHFPRYIPGNYNNILSADIFLKQFPRSFIEKYLNINILHLITEYILLDTKKNPGIKNFYETH